MNGRTKIRIGAWTASPALNLLECGERSVKVERRTMDVLVYLAERAGDVVSVEDLLGSVWKGVVVGDGSVYLAIKQLRQALTIPGDNTAYIETIPTRGYRLAAAVERLAAATAEPVAENPGQVAVAAASLSSSVRARLPWLATAALAGVLVVTLVPAIRYLLLEPAESPTMRLDLEVPGYVPGSLAISPDGRFVAYTAAAEGVRQIWARPLAASAAYPLPGTGGARHLFWSPDSRTIAFTTEDGTLKTVGVDGGLVQVLAKASPLAWGSGAWSRDDVILHTVQADSALRAAVGAETKAMRADFPIGSVPAAGGVIAAVTAPDVAQGETGHFVPRLLPDDDHFVYIAGGPSLQTATIYAASRSSPSRTALVPIEDLVKANRRWNLAYADGYLLYPRGTALVAHRFDVAALAVVGEPKTLALDVDDFAVSATGMLVYTERAPSPAIPVPQQRRLSWFDRNGTRLGEVDARGAFAGPELSPDGRRVAVVVAAAMPGASDVSIVDVERGLSLPITVDDVADGPVVWSLDGARIAFGSGRGSIPFTPSAIYEQSAGGTGARRLLFSGIDGELLLPSDWSTDAIVFSRSRTVGSRQTDIWILQTAGEASPAALIESPAARKRGAKLSPSGRWIAYTTDESGRDEVVVQRFPDVERGKWPISPRGGSAPRWRRDGRELYYVAPDGMLMAVDVPAPDSESFEPGQSRALFEMPQAGDAASFDYDVVADGERFLVSEPVDAATAAVPEPVRSLRVVFNWTETLGAE